MTAPAMHNLQLTDMVDTPLSEQFDPLVDDRDDDPSVVTTERRLIRLTLAACDLGARFARGNIDLDPGSWMLTARDLFDGKRGIDACQDLEPFIRCIIANGLDLSLDVNSQDLQVICDSLLQTSDLISSNERGIRWYICAVSGLNGHGRFYQATCAIADQSEKNARAKLASRFGWETAMNATIWDGSDELGISNIGDSALQLAYFLQVASEFSGTSNSKQDFYLLELKGFY